MAKQSKSDPVMKEAKRQAGEGTQSILPGGDYGARDLFGAATNPASVKAMVGKSGEFAKYKHDDS
jgi:hypothetical protein